MAGSRLALATDPPASASRWSVGVTRVYCALAVEAFSVSKEGSRPFLCREIVYPAFPKQEQVNGFLGSRKDETSQPGLSLRA